MVVADVIKCIEEFAPLSLAEDFDNCGLKIGDTSADLLGVMVTVDTNIDVVNEAKSKGCNLIIEHHPSIWKPLKGIDINVPLNAALVAAAKYDIAIYSAHTNVDYTLNGLNDYVAKKMGLENIRCVDSYSSARIGELSFNDIVTVKDYARMLSEIFDDDNIQVVGDLNKPIYKVSVINGGGGGSADAVLATYRAGADIFVTGDVKHSVARLAKDLNYVIIQFGHYASEACFCDLMTNVIEKSFPKLAIKKAESIDSPFNRRGELWI